MKERPILMSAPMVIATLDGRKTMTRRACKPQPHVDKQMSGGFALNILKRNYTIDMVSGSISVNAPHISECCPYGKVGDRLWLRETFAETDLADGTPAVSYRAGGCIPVGRRDDKKDYLITEWALAETPQPEAWHPSIFMPRWASRITLEIVGIRVERLQDISEEDCERELGALHHQLGDGAYREFKTLWESINGAGSWDINPWAWVIKYKRVL